MRQAWWLLAVVALSLASCRSRTGQTANTVVDPFLINRPTTIAPPQTGTVAPLGTIQPLDATTPALPPGTTIPPPGQPLMPGSTAPYIPPTTGASSPLLPSTAPATSSGVSFAGGANGYSGNSTSNVQLTNGTSGGRATTAGWTTPTTPISASPSATAPTDISNLPPVRR